MLKAEGKKPLRDYINKRQETVAEWVDLRHIFAVYAKETVYEVDGGVESRGDNRRLQNNI